jgi:DUF1680 family protein
MTQSRSGLLPAAGTLFIAVICGLCCLCACAPAADGASDVNWTLEDGRWSAEKANAWYAGQRWLAGANFVPSTASNQLEMWQAETFDPAAIDRELGYAAGVGFNVMRVFLHDMAWKADPAGFEKRMDEYLSIADRHGIKTLFVIFDSCWDPRPALGPQKEPVPHVHNSRWVQSPHIDLLRDASRYDELRPYLTAVMTRFKDDKRILGWDLLNEPGNFSANYDEGWKAGDKEAAHLVLLGKAFDWARAVNPSQPLTAGPWLEVGRRINPVPALDRLMLERSDVITFHTYETVPAVEKVVGWLKQSGRPIICTEYMSRGSGSTFGTVMPYLKEQNVGAIGWGLVNGRSQTIYPWDSWTKKYTEAPSLWFHDMFHKDGTPYLAEEASLIRSLTGGVSAASDYPVRPVVFSAVKLDDAFWKPRIETNRTVTVPFAFKKCDVRIANFRRAAKLEEGHFQGCPFDDSDVYKVMEGAAYCLATHPDPELARYLDDLIAVIAKAQEPDGYLYTARTIEGEKAPDRASNVRWLNELGGVNGVDSHELYNLGHMFEAAVAHYQATGKRNFLDVAVKAADLVCRTWGPGPDQLKIPPGHPEIELALVKLGRATGDPKYIDLARFLLECRGHYRRPEGIKVEMNDRYFSNEVPLEQLTEAVGHAVRTGYMLSGMTDVAALRDAPGMRRTIDAIWEDTVQTKIYLHGGIGSGVGMAEGFGESYRLPNTGYNETCAAIANVLWNHRMFLLYGDGKYLDVLERALYNNVLAGVSLSGDKFFYPNPLLSEGKYERSPWFGCACCPGNIVRCLPSVPGMVYASGAEQVYVCLYAAGTAETALAGGKVKLTQQTAYPWSGTVHIAVDPEKESAFELKLRIPGWAQGKPVPGGLYRYLDAAATAPGLKVNGEDVPVSVEKGFVSIRRTWKTGDAVDLDLPMPVRRVLANEKVADDAGLAALERGPIVYCVEEADNGKDLFSVVLDDKIALNAEDRPDLLGGVTVLTAAAEKVSESKDKKVKARPAALTAVPYYAWCNRGAGRMNVWLARSADRALSK